MQYLIQLQKNLRSENRFLNAALNFRDQNVEMNYFDYQQKLNKGTMIFIEICKVLFEISIAISALLLDYENIYSETLVLFPISSLIQIWIRCKYQKCYDCWKLIHVFAFYFYFTKTRGVHHSGDYLFLYTVYVIQSLNNKKYFVVYIILMQVTQQFVIPNFDWIVVPTIWLWLMCISIGVYFRERRKLVYFFEKFNINHDLSFQEAVLNHSLHQNLFVITQTKQSTDRPVDYFEVLFANEGCKKEFATLDNIYSKTSQINVVNCNCNESNVSYYNLKMNQSLDQFCNNFKGSTNEQINIMEKPLSLSSFLSQYIANFSHKEMPIKFPLKLTGINQQLQQQQQYHQTYDILVTPCIWKYQKCFLVSLIDVSDRNKVSQLEQLDQYKDLVLATVSHDLKNPISVIQSMISLVSEGLYEIQRTELLPHQQEQIKQSSNYLQMCQTNVQILQSFVNDLQDFAQIKQRKLKLTISQFDITQLIEELRSVFQLQFKKKNLQFDISTSLKCTQICNNDPLRIKQVLFNLISNALKFTCQGRILLNFSDDPSDILRFCTDIKQQIQMNKSVIDVAPLLRNKQKIFVCTVTDSGSGISVQVQRGLFRNFATYDNEKKINKNGVGLGLIICKQLCGYIGPLQYMYLRSEVSVGSTFQFAIYKNYDKQSHYEYSGEQSSVDSIDYDISVHSPHKNMYSTHHLTPLCRKQKVKELIQVLIVDDEPFNNMILKGQLCKIGVINTDIAYSGKEAIDMIAKKKYDIVFMDVNMPGLNGISCIRQIRPMASDIKIFMLTASNDLETKQICYDAGADKIFEKPLTSQQLELLFN